MIYKRLAIILPLILMISGTVSADSELKLTISQRQSAHFQNGPVNIQFTVKNPTSQDQYLLLSPYFYDHLDIQITTEKNRAVPKEPYFYLEVHNRMLQASKTELAQSTPLQDFTLKPNATFGFDVDLSNYFDFTGSGTYRVSATWHPFPMWINKRLHTQSASIIIQMESQLNYGNVEEDFQPLDDEMPSGRRTPFIAIEELLKGRIKNNANLMFDIFEIDKMIYSFPNFSHRMRGQARVQSQMIIKQFKEFIMKKFLSRLKSFEILQVVIIGDKAKINVSVKRGGDGISEPLLVKEMYQFRLRKVSRGATEYSWIVYHYDVDRPGGLIQ